VDWETAAKLWEVKMSPRKRSKLRAEILRRKDAPREVLERFVARENKDTFAWEDYLEIGQQLEEPWKEMTLERWRNVGHLGRAKGT
jgi:hypothetical protein